MIVGTGIVFMEFCLAGRLFVCKYKYLMNRIIRSRVRTYDTIVARNIFVLFVFLCIVTACRTPPQLNNIESTKRFC